MKLASTLALLLAPMISVAADNNIVYECTHGNAKRVIEVNYMTSAPVPCAVVYSKAEGRKVLWSAQNSEGYCEQKAAAFVEKQQGWGWDCNMASEQQLAEEQTAVTEVVIEVAAEPETSSNQ